MSNLACEVSDADDDVVSVLEKGCSMSCSMNLVFEGRWSRGGNWSLEISRPVKETLRVGGKTLAASRSQIPVPHPMSATLITFLVLSSLDRM